MTTSVRDQGSHKGLGDRKGRLYHTRSNSQSHFAWESGENRWYNWYVVYTTFV